MKVEEFNFPSADRRTEIHSYRWIPDGEVKAVLQIVHGMVEHISRYQAFAEYLTRQGILVTGNDILGHGRSVAEQEELWHFPKNGNLMILRDIHTLRAMTQEKYPDVPYFLLGHSMGSYFTRQYICLEGEGLAGVMIIGTGDERLGTILAGDALARIKCRIQGPMHHSKLLTKMAFQGYNKRINETPTKYEWLSRDADQVWAYAEDPLCGGRFTNGAFHEFFRCMLFLKKKAYLKKMPKELPILCASGEEDPVGGYGKGVLRTAQGMRGAGLWDVSCRLYPGDRHEIINELDREQVWQDLKEWMEAHLPRE